MNNKKKLIIAMIMSFVLAISCSSPAGPNPEKEVISLPKVITDLGTKKVASVDGVEVSIDFTKAKGSGKTYTVSVTAPKVEAVLKSDLEKVLSPQRNITVALVDDKAKVTLDGGIEVTIDGGNKVFFAEKSVSVSSLNKVISQTWDIKHTGIKPAVKFNFTHFPVSRVNATEFLLNENKPIRPTPINNVKQNYSLLTQKVAVAGTPDKEVVWLRNSLYSQLSYMPPEILASIDSNNKNHSVCIYKSVKVDGELHNDMALIFNIGKDIPTNNESNRPTKYKYDIRIRFTTVIGNTEYNPQY